jgi:sugar phosphate isomerase/epimerase
MKIGTTTLPLAGWAADPRQPEQAQRQRLAAIRQIVESYGLHAVELTLDLAMVYPHIFDAGFYATVASLQQELAFTCTVHLPFLWVDPASLNETVRQASVACLQRSAELTQPLQVETYVLHLWGLATTQIVLQFQDPAQQQAILEALMAQAGRSLADVCQILDPRDVCVENLEAPAFDAVLPVVEAQDASICLDVGHLAWQGDGELEFLARHANRIREVHLHDSLRPPRGRPGPVRDHLPLGSGEMDYTAFLAELAAIGFRGAVILENNSQADLEQSLERIAAYL